ncbi:MAG: DUF2975 domain-containing protein [Bacilli bacterium]|nr:DUF2975 domain-containing protein [Bacilli bacterium]MBN2696759.1 DUF2975 domain-containing protein [Bacilli bacterium]
MKWIILFLKTALMGLAVPMLAINIFFLPDLVVAANQPIPSYAPMLYPIVIAIYLGSLPYYFGLYKSFVLLCQISNNETYSEKSIQALKSIRYSATVISVMFLICLPYAYVIADKTDAPGIMAIALFVTGLSIAVTFSAGLFQLVIRDTMSRLTKTAS